MSPPCPALHLPALHRPVLTDAARPATFVVPAIDEHGATIDTPIAGEHALTLYVDKEEILTIMTLGAAPEALALGYLRNQRLLDSIDDVLAVQVDWGVDAVVVKTRNGIRDLAGKTAKRTKTSGCGQGTVFGDLMADIDNVRLPQDARLKQTTLYDLLNKVRLHETIYKQAGAVHGCALATNSGDSSEILYFVARPIIVMPTFCAMSYPICVRPERDTRNGIPICAALMTISEVRRPVV